MQFYLHRFSVALCGVIIFVIACGANATPVTPQARQTSLSNSTATHQILPQAINPIWSVPPSIDEQILTSAVIVRALLLSVTAETETVVSDAGVASTYRPAQKLQFTSHEYLKGKGPSEVIVIVRGKHTYLTEAEAQEASDQALSRRNTTWDGSQGVLFLNRLYPLYTPSGEASQASGQASAEIFSFTLSNHVVQSNWDYSIDTLSRAWLPAGNNNGTSGQASESAIASFITDGSISTPLTISLADLRSKIEEIDALQTDKQNTPSYQECVFFKVTRERHYRDRPYTPPKHQGTILSGMAAGTLIHIYSDTEGSFMYHNFWLSGPNSSLFRTSIVDDDSDPSNGYNYTLTTARPLPVGEYRVFHIRQNYRYIPCDFKPDNAYRDWTVTVTAPDGAIHEAFFDPSADGISDVTPTEFLASGATTRITELRWQDGEVTLSLFPYTPMDGYFLDFIALDGSVALSLNLTAGAPLPSRSGVNLTWPVTERPWQDGDRLMLRIREADSAPAIVPTPVASGNKAPENPGSLASACESADTYPHTHAAVCQENDRI